MHRCYVLIDPRSGQPRYIGITHKRLATRLTEHKSSAGCGSPYPVHRWIRSLQRLSLVPQIMLLETTTDRLRECVWISLFRERGARLLNCTIGGEGVCNPTLATRQRMGVGQRGKKASPETRERLRQSHLGKKNSPEAIAKFRATMLGRKHPPSFGAAISARQKGMKISDGAREKMRAAKLGKPLSPDHKAKIGAAHKGKSYGSHSPLSAEHKAKIAAAITGRKHTEEAKAKMRKPKSAEMRAKLSATKTGTKRANHTVAAPKYPTP